MVDMVKAAMLYTTDGVENDEASRPLDVRWVKEWVCVQRRAYAVCKMIGSLFVDYFGSPSISSLRFRGPDLLGFTSCRVF